MPKVKELWQKTFERQRAGVEVTPVTEDIIWKNASVEQVREVSELLNRIPPGTGIRIGEVSFKAGIEPSYAKIPRRIDLPSDKPIDPDVIYHEASHGFPSEVMDRLISLTEEAEPRVLVTEQGIAVAFARYMTGVPATTEGSIAAVNIMKREYGEVTLAASDIKRLLEQKNPSSIKARARISWTRESTDERIKILKKLGLEQEPYWAQPWDKLPSHYKEAIAIQYSTIYPDLRTMEGNPDRICPVCKGFISVNDYWVLERPERNIYLCTKGHLEQYALTQGQRVAERRGYRGEEEERFAKGWAKAVMEPAKHIIKGGNPVSEVTPGFYVLKPISAEAKDWVTILSEDYKRTPEGDILVRPSDMPGIGKLIREDYLDITKDFTVTKPPAVKGSNPAPKVKQEASDTFEDLLPMSPGQGPPLPRGLGLKWPWKR